MVEGQSLTVSPSIGIAVFPRDGSNADTLIMNADAARKLALANDLRRAIAGELNLARLAIKISRDTLFAEALAGKTRRCKS